MSPAPRHRDAMTAQYHDAMAPRCRTPTDGKNTRPSVSEIVVDMLTRHRVELDKME